MRNIVHMRKYVEQCLKVKKECFFKALKIKHAKFFHKKSCRKSINLKHTHKHARIVDITLCHIIAFMMVLLS